MEFLLIILMTTLTSFASLIGGFFLLGKSKLANLLNIISKPIAVVVLLYCVFFDLLPESLEENTLPLWEAIVLMVVGLLICFVVNYLVKSIHSHGEKKVLKTKSEAYSMLVIDSLHTITDGIAIGVTFATSLQTGVVTSLSIIAHEIPQEIGDFGIMIRSKIPKARIIKLQIASSLLLVPSALISFFVGENLVEALPPFLALIAGSFLYIALREIFAIIEEAKEEREQNDDNL